MLDIPWSVLSGFKMRRLVFARIASVPFSCHRVRQASGRYLEHRR
jgi:hypothetical protein